MSIADRLNELGIELPPAAEPVGAYVAAVRSGELVFISGQLPMQAGKMLATGKVGSDVDLETAQSAACVAVLNGLAAIQQLLGDLDSIAQVVRLEVFVNSAAGFTDQAKVANGASEVLQDIFGPSGRHARQAVGVAELPLDAPVELSLIVQVKS